MIETVDIVFFDIAQAQEYIDRLYPYANHRAKIQLKCWQKHVDYQKHKGSNKVYSYNTYLNMTGPEHIIGQINLGVLDCQDVGGKEVAIQTIRDWYCWYCLK